MLGRINAHLYNIQNQTKGKDVQTDSHKIDFAMKVQIQML